MVSIQRGAVIFILIGLIALIGYALVPGGSLVALILFAFGVLFVLLGAFLLIMHR